jgi:hypothetical protein
LFHFDPPGVVDGGFTSSLIPPPRSETDSPIKSFPSCRSHLFAFLIDVVVPSLNRRPSSTARLSKQNVYPTAIRRPYGDHQRPASAPRRKQIHERELDRDLPRKHSNYQIPSAGSKADCFSFYFPHLGYPCILYFNRDDPKSEHRIRSRRTTGMV